MKSLSDSFCPLPWINLSTDVGGSLRPCCKFAQPAPDNEFQLPNMKEGDLNTLWNDIRFQDLRQAFLDGKKPKECLSCWNEESAGLKSFRTQFVLDKNLDVSNIEFTAKASCGPRALDLKLNNVCNLKCRICGPQASSTFLKEFQEQFNIKIEDSSYWLSNKILGTANEEVICNWASDITHIEITGGEPMASPENIKILELIVQSGNNEHINIVLNTNGTLYNKKLIDLLLKFKKVIFCVSIDDIESRLEYERFPAEWTDIINNLTTLTSIRDSNNNIEIWLCPTVSIFNVYYLPEYKDWADKVGVGMYFNMLHYLPYYSIKNLPNELKEVVRSRLTEETFSSVLNFLNLPADETSITSFIRENKARDKIRNQNFKDTFGYWGELIMEYDNE